MSRRKICLPQINANKDISVNKELLQGEFENLTMGEVIVNVSPENTSLIVVNDSDEPSVFEPSNVFETKFNELYEKSHQHSNKDVLDNITSGNVESWNNAEQNAISTSAEYVDKQIIFLLSGATGAFDTLKEVEDWINSHSGETNTLIEDINNLTQSAHTHGNKAILDSLTEDVINSWNNGEKNVIEKITLNSEELSVVNKTVNIDLSEYLTEVPSGYAKTNEIQSWVNEKVDGKFDTIGSASAAEAAAKADAAEKYQVKGNYEAAGAAAQALVDAKADAAEKYQVKGNYETAGAAAQALTDAKADAAEKYQPKGNYEVAGTAAVVDGKIENHKNNTTIHITSQERNNWSAAKSAIDTFLADADMTENAVDTLRELQSYMTADGEAAAELVNKISALEAIDHNAYISADTQVLADAKADAANKYQPKGNYETAGAAATAKNEAIASAKTWVEDQDYVTATDLNNKKYATETWVENKKYLTSVPAEYAKKTDIPSLDGYATQTWVENKKYLTSVPAEYAKKTDIPSLDGYATQTWVENKGYLTSIPSKYVDSDELTSELESYMTISGAGLLSTEIYGNMSAGVITSIESAQTWVNSENFLKSISLSSSTGKTYLVGKDSKTGSTTSLTTSTDDIYMEDGVLYATSDERLKDFGDNISVDLDKLSEIPKAYYTWKTNPQGRKMIGLSAQKIGALYPEVVSTDENGKMAVSYEKLSVIALAAIDELHKENEELKDRLKRIEEKLGL